MDMRKPPGIAMMVAALLLPGATIAGPRFDGNWVTHLACEAHGQTPAYKWEFPSTITDGVFHGQHGENGGPGYLVIDGKIGDDGSAKLSAKGTVESEHNNAHGVFALKGNNYDYTIQAQFADARGTGTRNEGAGILGRPCNFVFDKQPASAPDAAPAAPAQ
jgi:hypothetical protein